MLYALRLSALRYQRGLGCLDHLGAAADQDLPIAPAAVPGHHVGQQPRLAYVQATGGSVSVVGGPRRVG